MEENQLEQLINVAEGQKNKGWANNMTKHVYELAISNASYKETDRESWELYNGNINEHNYDYLRKFGTYEVPAFVRFIPIQRHYIDVLKAQQIRRRFPMSVYITDEELVKQKHTEKIRASINAAITQYERTSGQYGAIIENITSQVQQVQQMMQQEPENEEQAQQLQELKTQFPYIKNEFNVLIASYNRAKKLKEKDTEKLNTYYRREYKDHKEVVAQKLKVKLDKELGVKEKAVTAFINQVVTGTHYYYTDYKEGHRLPTFEALNSLKVYYPEIDSVNFTQYLPWAMILDSYSYTDIVRLYGKDIKKEYGEQVLKNIGEYGFYAAQTNQMLAGPNGEGYFVDNTMSNGFSGTGFSNTGITAGKIFFKSNREVKVKKSPNPYQDKEFFTHIIDASKNLINKDDYYYRDGYYKNKKNNQDTYYKNEAITYSEKKGEKMESYMVQDLYEAVIIAGEYVIQARKKKYTQRDDDNRSIALLPIYGKVRGNFNKDPYSLIQYTKDIQELYNIVNYQRELLIAISGGKGTVIDYSQKPPEMSTEEWEYNMKMGKLYIATVNSTGRPINPSYNQWKDYDNTMSPVVIQLTQILQELEETMGRIIGVNRQMLGQVVNSDQVKTSQQALGQSMLIIEPLYYECDLILSQALTSVLNHAINNCYKEGEIVSIFYDDLDEDIVKIPEGLMNFNFQARIIDNPYQVNQLETLRSQMQNFALQGLLPARAMIDSIKIDTLKELEEKFVEYEELRSQEQQQSAQAQQQHEQQLKELDAQMKKQIEDDKRKVEQLKIQVDKEKFDFDARAKLLELDIMRKKNESDVNLGLLELTNEQRTETSIMNQNKELTLNEQNLREFEIKLNFYLSMLKIKNDNEMNKENADAKAKSLSTKSPTAQGKGAQHVSDK